MVAILGAALVFRALDGVRYWFEAQVKSKYVVWAENAVFLGIAAVKVGMILAGAPLVAFAWAAFAEVVVVALALAGVYLKKGGRFADWRVKLARAVRPPGAKGHPSFPIFYHIHQHAPMPHGYASRRYSLRD
jgi:O-antigen/teichoic acid export membrane protein